jgi:surface-anchored protein
MKIRSTPRPSWAALLAAVAVSVLLAPGAAWAQDGEQRDLDQTLKDLEIVHGDRVLDAGHVDMGPKYDGDTWRFLIHDDVARADAGATSVWRYPDETVFRVLDQGRLTMPDDPAYSFTGAQAGDPIWVVPQTQNPDVVWLGWNTQDPRVMESIDRGVTLSLTGAQGPGVASVYLQSGAFGEPQVLWDSRNPTAQPLWVDVNTHTHANWVFTEPGVYLLRLRAEADLVDGSRASDTQILRFAVGSKTSTKSALAATWKGPAEPDSAEGTDTTDASTGADPASSEGPLVPILIGMIALVAAALVVGLVVALVRSGRARKQVLGARAAATSGDDEVTR